MATQSFDFDSISLEYDQYFSWMEAGFLIGRHQDRQTPRCRYKHG